MVSRAMRSCLLAGSAASVDMLCRRSDSLMIRTRNVLGHRHEHLAHRGGLLRFLRVELDAFELGDAVDDPGHVGAELGNDALEGDVGVFDGVVEQRAPRW